MASVTDKSMYRERITISNKCKSSFFTSLAKTSDTLSKWMSKSCRLSGNLLHTSVAQNISAMNREGKEKGKKTEKSHFKNNQTNSKPTHKVIK